MASQEAGNGIQARLVPREERSLQDTGFAACFGAFLVATFALGFNSVANASSIGKSSSLICLSISATSFDLQILWKTIWTAAGQV